jgi:hypothetical protein
MKAELFKNQTTNYIV